MKVDLEKWKNNWFDNEEQFQAFCILMISQEFPKLRGKVWHTPNEQYIPRQEGESESDYKLRCARYGNMNKAKGKVAGVKDILIKFNGILYPIELKQPKRGMNDAQKIVNEVWNKDCPQIPEVLFFTPYEVYMYCKWIVATNLKINFPQDFKSYQS